MTIDVGVIAQIDQEIDRCMSLIRTCSPLPPEKRVMATTRQHEYLRLLEEARHQMAKEVFPDLLPNRVLG
jgi:hypothetical protein